MEVVNLSKELERLWTDETPDHLDPDVKKYWRVWYTLIGMLLMWIGPGGLVVIPFFYVFVLAGMGICLSAALCLLIEVMLVFAIASWYAGMYYKSFTFLLTHREVIISRGILFKKRVVIPYNRVQNINVTSNPLERFWNIHTVHIHTAGLGVQMAEGKIPGIPFPDELAAIIMKRVREHKTLENSGMDPGDIKTFMALYREYTKSKGG